MSVPDMGRPGVWRELFPHALALMASFEKQIHGAAFLQQLHARADLLEAEFHAIDAIGYQRSFAACSVQAKAIIEPLLARAAC